MDYYLVHSEPEDPAPWRQVIHLSETDYVVPVDQFNGRQPDHGELIDAADNPGLTVIPLIEQLEWEPEEHVHDKCGRTCYGS